MLRLCAAIHTVPNDRARVVDLPFMFDPVDELFMFLEEWDWDTCSKHLPGQD
jgi:hypothetical protein